jgi:hypothetical protein
MTSRTSVIIHSLCLALNSHVTTLLYSKENPIFAITACMMVFNLSMILLLTKNK